MRVRLLLLVPLLCGLAACGGGSHASSSRNLPYKVSFVNDSAKQVEVVGCPDCGTGFVLHTGQSWNTGMTGGAADVHFRRSGAEVGCVHFVNGALPEKDAPPTVIHVTAYTPCRS